MGAAGWTEFGFFGFWAGAGAVAAGVSSARKRGEPGFALLTWHAAEPRLAGVTES